MFVLVEIDLVLYFNAMICKMLAFSVFHSFLCSDAMKVDWAKQHHVETVFNGFLNDEFKPLTPLPGAPDQQPGPPQPTLSLLAWGSGKAKDTLKTPDKLLKNWWDGNFSTEFRAFVEEARQNHALDIKITEDTSPNQAQKRRRVNEGGGSVPGQAGSNNPSPNSGNQPQPVEIKAVDISDIPTLCFASKVTANPKLVLKVTIGQGVFIENQGDEPEAVRAGVTLCGFYKGKFWTPDGEAADAPSEKADVLFRLESGSDYVILNSKFVQLSEVIKSKRQLTPADAHVGFHDLTDAPTPTDAAAFTLAPKKVNVYFKVTDFPAVKQEDGGEEKLMIPSAHLAGAVPPGVWQTSCVAKLIWAVKWPAVASKGLQPIRPMVVSVKEFTVPSKKAVELVKPST